MSIVEYESAHVTPPLANSSATVCIATIQAVPNGGFTDLTKIFGRLNTGHFLSLQADGSKVYVAFGAVPTMAIGTVPVIGTGTNQAWPIPDGVEKSFKLIDGREGVGTAVLPNAQSGTGITWNGITQMYFKYLQYKSVATCALSIYRSSVAPGQGPEQFPVPGV